MNITNTQEINSPQSESSLNSGETASSQKFENSKKTSDKDPISLAQKILEKINNQNGSFEEANPDIRDLSFIQACQALLKSNAIIHPKTFHALIGKVHKFVVLEHFYLNQPESKEYLNVNFFNAIIAKGTESEKFFKIAISAFIKTIWDKIENTETFSTFIFAAGKTDHFGDAKKAFNLAISKKLANTGVYNEFIHAAIKSKLFNTAQKALETAKSLGLANTETDNLAKKIAASDKTDHGEQNHADDKALEDWWKIVLALGRKVKSLEKSIKSLKETKALEEWQKASVFGEALKILNPTDATDPLPVTDCETSEPAVHTMDLLEYSKEVDTDHEDENPEDWERVFYPLKTQNSD